MLRPDPILIGGEFVRDAIERFPARPSIESHPIDLISPRGAPLLRGLEQGSSFSNHRRPVHHVPAGMGMSPASIRSSVHTMPLGGSLCRVCQARVATCVFAPKIPSSGGAPTTCCQAATAGPV